VHGRSTIWIYRIDPREIHYLQFLLKAADGVATLTTLDVRKGLFRFRCRPALKEPLRSLWPSVGDLV